MKRSVCGIDCDTCTMKDGCRGCAETNGRPFGGDCVVAKCHASGSGTGCTSCTDGKCEMKKRLIDEFNALGIVDMPELTELCSLRGDFINMEYRLPGGETARFWNDSCVYLGYQLEKRGSDRCYGLATDGRSLLVCEYGAEGADAEIVVFRRI